ncbi:hypothetical protein ARC78_04080 [Stenotrophomonas pictorum JCM 9942]|uniref:DUF4381 domain-containing protein n=1 Tax=Stenotrophomonas pictorum JCM 9942 TaxID=1236960 RepID=A0A0R0AJ35_9GAMM|nr:DUF4381 domain-containing protein [Stenotrophomonas pictorum]KRG44997.1 hypothetical protein ARC78_04080 [Stenotrophomonas pictorum JCM 9942]
MTPLQLPLRDVHLPAAPGWWPLAPGGWLVLGCLALVVLAGGAWWSRRRRRRRNWTLLFDRQIGAAGPGAAQLAAASELLRRAAARMQPEAACLQDEAWLRFLDGSGGADFTAGDGRWLLDGGFRPAVDEVAAARALVLARRRFLELMAGHR